MRWTKQMDERLKILLDPKNAPRVRAGKHVKKCECAQCLKTKLDEFKARIALMGGVVPDDSSKTIPVRPHWRFGKNHLKNDPALREAVEAIVKNLLRQRH